MISRGRAILTFLITLTAVCPSIVWAEGEGLTTADYQEYINNFVGAMSYQLPEPASTLSSLLFAAPAGINGTLKAWAYQNMLSASRNLLDADASGSAEMIKYYNNQLDRWQAVYNCLNGDCGSMQQMETAGQGGGTESITGPTRGTATGQVTGTGGDGAVKSGNKSYRQGSLLIGPISIPAAWTTPTDVLFLDEGRPYIVVGEGSCSLWSDHTDGVDSCFCYAQWRCGDTPQVWGQLELINPSVHLSDLIATDSEGRPVYNPSHIYQGVVVGEGKVLQARLYDGGGYEDNNGELRISVYDAIASS